MPPSSSLAPSGQLVHGYIRSKSNPSVRLNFMVNPSELTFVKQNRWSNSTKKGQDVAQTEFLGGAPMTLKLTLYYDFSEDDVNSLDGVLNTLDQMTLVETTSRDPINHLGSPPPLMFMWGSGEEYSPPYLLVITERTLHYTRFSLSGNPSRVEVNLSFQEYFEDKPRQNPTSGGVGAERYYQARPNQTIDLIAYEVFGDSGRWRAIAEANNMDNPLALRAGQMLRIIAE